MTVRRVMLFLGAGLLAIASSMSIAGAASVETDLDSSEDLPRVAPLQSEEEALRQDLTLVAEAKGWTVEEAAADRAAADHIGAIAEVVATDHPELFVGSALSPEPGAPATLYIKGPANREIRDLLRSADMPVTLRDNQPYSFWELEQRSVEVSQLLSDAGFRDIFTGFDLDGGGLIEAGVTVRSSRSVDEEETAIRSVLAALPEHLAGAVEIAVNDFDIVVDEHVYGGVRIDTPGGCTTGWTVADSSGTTGVTTAGHCSDPKSNIVAPGEGTPSFVDEHRGAYGDVEWYTSNHVEPAEFYATATARRNTTQIEAIANLSVGESICQYGRYSNDRDCTLDVDQVSVTCVNSGVSNSRLVLMDGDTGIPGDSGGGWSWANRAYGGHKGNCSGTSPVQEVFSAAAYFPNALGVTVRTQ